MEGIRSDDDEADDKDKLSDGKKKRADKVGLFALEQKTAKAKDETEKRDDLLSLLTRKTVEIEAKPDESEESEEENLTPAETKQLEQAIVQQRYQELATDNDRLDQDELNAVKSFHEKIIDDDIDSDQSLIETLAELSTTPEIVPVEFTEKLITIDRISEANPAIQDPEPIIQIESVDDLPHEFTEEPVSIKLVGHEAKVVDDVVSEDTNIFTQLSQSIAAAPRNIASLINPKVERGKDAGNEANGTKNDESKPSGRNLIDDVVNLISISREKSSKSDQRQNQVKMNLEKQVGTIERGIIAKETVVRRLVAERKLTPQPELSRAKAPEASRLHASVAPERIGRVLMTVEADSSKNTPKVEALKPQPVDRNIETIDRTDLLELSGQAVVDGSTLRQAYETNLISEKALRRLVAEHLRGGDVRRALRRELVEHEKDFERDPLLRDKPHVRASNSNISLNKLIQRLENRPVANRELITIKNQIPIITKSSRKQKRLSFLDIAMLATILVLLFMVIALVINRQ